jgi:hemerythrin-like metal-binding protein
MSAVWSDELAIDHGEIDRDHRRIFELSERLIHSDETQGATLILQELLDFIAIHFSHEEAMMSKLHYPGKAHHVAEHDHHHEMLCLLQTGGGDLKEAVGTFLAVYLRDHICVFDRALSEWCRSRVAISQAA